jgi:TatD DNase family protein
MYSDTHCHINLIAKEDATLAIDVLKRLASKNTPFVLDIGTVNNDLTSRVKLIESLLNELREAPIVSDSDTLKKHAIDMLYFSAGIWPAVEEINSRLSSVSELENQIDTFKNNSCGTIFSPTHLVALGECGLDHHWNPSGVDGRNEDDFTKKMVTSEAELFEMQLGLAQKKDLAVIVHSRDAFDGTLSCIKNIGYHRGIIHCYSYGIEEAKRFLDLGWYISFSGSVTYTKKRDMDEMAALIQYIPRDRILCETDSPYLAPVPFRGKKNNPELVEFVYKFVAQNLNMEPELLSKIVYSNACNLFRI